jgi:DNA-binding transcriptional ArsR family regulator
MQGRSALLPLLRTALLGDILAWVYLHPEEEWSVTELARRFQVSQSTVSREADRLVEGELVVERRRGTLRLLRAAVDGPLAVALTELLLLTYGPLPVLGELLAELDGVEEALIYGSWAARYAGEPGPPPNDIDVLVIGDPDEDELFDVARAAQRRLGREVNAHRISARTWRTRDSDPFLDSVRSRPRVSIDLTRSPHDVAAGSGGHRGHDPQAGARPRPARSRPRRTAAGPG